MTQKKRIFRSIYDFDVTLTFGCFCPQTVSAQSTESPSKPLLSTSLTLPSAPRARRWVWAAPWSSIPPWRSTSPRSCGTETVGENENCFPPFPPRRCSTVTVCPQLCPWSPQSGSTAIGPESGPSSPWPTSTRKTRACTRSASTPSPASKPTPPTSLSEVKLVAFLKYFCYFWIHLHFVMPPSNLRAKN